MSSTILPRSNTAPPAPAVRRRRLVLGLGLALGLLGLVYTADVALARDELPRGTRIAGVDVGGRSEADAARLLRDRLAARVSAPVQLTAAGQVLTLDPATAGLSLDVEATIDRARTGGLAPWSRVTSFFSITESGLVAAVDDDRLRTAMRALAAKVDRPAREGAIRFDGVTPVPVEPQAGRTLDVEGAAQAVADAYLVDDAAAVVVPVEVAPVRTMSADVARLLAEVATPAVSAPVTLTGDGKQLVIQPRDVAASLRIEADQSGTLVATVDAAKLEAALSARLAAIEVKPRDARFSLVNGAVQIAPSAKGREVDVAAMSASLVDVLRRPAPRTGLLPMRDAEPKLSTARAQSLGIKEPIGTFTTYHPAGRPRVRNIHRMADIVNGALVLPGETFSLNGYVGPRDRKRGFVEAPMILDGEFVDSVGGGVSQFATTMYNAVFFSGLEDVEHKAHSYYISRYPAGREATVSFPNPDLKWRNNSPAGVLVTTAYTDRSITVTFWGTKQYDVIESVSGPRTRVRGVYTEYRSGRGCESRGGAPGFDIVVQRIFKKGGKVVKTEKIFTRYRVESKIVCVRRAPAASPTPSS